MRRPSTRFSRCIESFAILNIVFLFGVVLSLFPASIPATTRSSSTRTVRPTTTSKPYYILPFFLPDSEPLSRVASVIHKTTIITTTIIRPTTTTITSLSVKTLTTASPTANSKDQDGESNQEAEITLQLDCPTALSPENEACRAARIYPAIVTGRRGVDDNDDNLAQTHVWKGETTYLLGDDTTTTWTCWQGMSLRTGVPAPTQTPDLTLPTAILNPEIAPGPAAPTKRNAVGEVVPYAQCVSTIVQDHGNRTRFVTRRYGEYYCYRHLVPVVVGVGDGIMNERGEDEVERMNSGWESRLSRLGCDIGSASRMIWAGTVTEAVAIATGTGEAAGEVKTSGGVVGLGGGSLMLGSSSLAWAAAVALMDRI